MQRLKPSDAGGAAALRACRANPKRAMRLPAQRRAQRIVNTATGESMSTAGAVRVSSVAEDRGPHGRAAAESAPVFKGMEPAGAKREQRHLLPVTRPRSATPHAVTATAASTRVVRVPQAFSVAMDAGVNAEAAGTADAKKRAAYVAAASMPLPPLHRRAEAARIPLAERFRIAHAVPAGSVATDGGHSAAPDAEPVPARERVRPAVLS